MICGSIYMVSLIRLKPLMGVLFKFAHILRHTWTLHRAAPLSILLTCSLEGGESDTWGSYFWCLGAVPPAGSGGRAHSQGSVGRSTPEADSFSMHKYLTFALYEALRTMQNLLGSSRGYKTFLGGYSPSRCLE